MRKGRLDMVMMSDRRRHSRNPIDWPVSLYHPRLSKFINGRSVDVSQSGAKIALPLAVPIRPGQIVELNFPRTTTLAKLAGSFSRIKTATVVRVESDAPPADPIETGVMHGAAASMSFSHLAGATAPLVLTAAVKTARPRRQMVAVRFDKNALAGK